MVRHVVLSPTRPSFIAKYESRPLPQSISVTRLQWEFCPSSQRLPGFFTHVAEVYRNAKAIDHAIDLPRCS